ncbi:Uncharacterized protein RDABS01_001578 [Bienertia sinuspersici]
MPKSKKSIVTKEEYDAREEKPSTSLKKVDEIDDIFASRKRKKHEQEKAEKTIDKNEKSRKKKKKIILKGGEAFNPVSKPRRRTNDGLAVYTEEELKINSQDGGSTALCPFDCSCCF